MLPLDPSSLETIQDKMVDFTILAALFLLLTISMTVIGIQTSNEDLTRAAAKFMLFATAVFYGLGLALVLTGVIG